MTCVVSLEGRQMPRAKKVVTTVVNKNDSKYDVDITRNNRLWGNPYIIGSDGTREEVIEKYSKYIDRLTKGFPNVLDELRGKTLGCVCKPLPCHGDVLVERLKK